MDLVEHLTINSGRHINDPLHRYLAAEIKNNFSKIGIPEDSRTFPEVRLDGRIAIDLVAIDSNKRIYLVKGKATVSSRPNKRKRKTIRHNINSFLREAADFLKRFNVTPVLIGVLGIYGRSLEHYRYNR